MLDTLDDNQFPHLIRRARGRGVAAEVCQQRLVEALWYLPLWWKTDELRSTAFMIVAWGICGRNAEYHYWWKSGQLKRIRTRKPIKPMPASIETWQALEGYLLGKLAARRLAAAARADYGRAAAGSAGKCWIAGDGNKARAALSATWAALRSKVS